MAGARPGVAEDQRAEVQRPADAERVRGPDLPGLTQRSAAGVRARRARKIVVAMGPATTRIRNSHPTHTGSGPETGVHLTVMPLRRTHDSQTEPIEADRLWSARECRARPLIPGALKCSSASSMARTRARPRKQPRAVRRRTAYGWWGSAS